MFFLLWGRLSSLFSALALSFNQPPLDVRICYDTTVWWLNPVPGGTIPEAIVVLPNQGEDYIRLATLPPLNSSYIGTAVLNDFFIRGD